MSSVFVVQHEYELYDRDEVKLIGIYATQADAKAAISRARLQPGFCDWPDAFTIDKYTLGEDHWTEGFVTINETVKA